jgi:hypothetical protein
MNAFSFLSKSVFAKGENMNLQLEFTEAQDDAEPVRLQEQFSGQIEDASLLAEQILAEQQEAHENSGNAPLFVP